MRAEKKPLPRKKMATPLLDGCTHLRLATPEGMIALVECNCLHVREAGSTIRSGSPHCTALLFVSDELTTTIVGNCTCRVVGKLGKITAMNHRRRVWTVIRPA
jgi:hypothetical protein